MNLTETNARAEHDGGTLTISDVDSAGDLRGADRHGRAAYGTFSIDADGRLDLHGELGATTSSWPATTYTDTLHGCQRRTARRRR